MPARLIAVDGKTVTLELTLELSRSLLATEERILAVLNEAGCVATQEALKQLDTDGSPLMIGAVKLTSKGSVPKAYQTPYGEVTVARQVYQTAQGGKTFCPLDQKARIVVTSNAALCQDGRSSMCPRRFPAGRAGFGGESRPGGGTLLPATPGGSGGQCSAGAGRSLGVGHPTLGRADRQCGHGAGWDLPAAVSGRLPPGHGGECVAV